jgi:hypothetical protein
VHFDTALNLAWVLLGVIALAGTVRASVRRNRIHRCSVWLHVIGVALIIAALFPYISATDDLVRSEDLGAAHHHNQSPFEKRNPNKNLIRLYETLDSPLACATCTLTVTFVAVWITLPSRIILDRRIAPALAGRSPPLAFAA